MNYPTRREILGYLRAHEQWSKLDGRNWQFGDGPCADVRYFGTSHYEWVGEVAKAEERETEAVVGDIRHNDINKRLDKLEEFVRSVDEWSSGLADAKAIERAFSDLGDSLRVTFSELEARFRALERSEQRLVPPWSEIDYGIRPLVRDLYDAGLQPFASCEGGEGHLADKPFVNIASNPDELDDIANKAAAVMVENGWRGFNVSRVTNHQAEASPWPEFPSYVSIELWEGVDVDDA